MNNRFNQVVLCRNACIEEIGHLLMKFKTNKFIRSFNKRWVLEVLCVFEITLWTGETYELYISLDKGLSKTRFINASSQLDIIIVGSVHYVDLIPCFHEFKNRLMKRFWGYRLESVVEKYLIDFIKNNPDGYLKSIRRGTVKEEYCGKDFILGCVVARKEFEICFDLKSNPKEVDSARERLLNIPTLYTTEKELKNRPTDFDNKLAYLVSIKFRKLFLGISTLPELRHVK